MLPFYVCEECYQILASENEHCAAMWMTACHMLVNFPHYVLSVPGESNELTILENAGFLVTTETDKKVYIISLTCLDDEENGLKFCACGEDEEDH